MARSNFFRVQLNYNLNEWSKLKAAEKDAICKGYIDQLASQQQVNLRDGTYHWSVMPNYNIRRNRMTVLIGAEVEELNG